MIGLRDSVTLARTKLRAKRTRMIVTVVVSGLVFGLVIGALAIFSGVSSSLESYANKQFEGKYFVSATRTFDYNEYYNPSDPKRIARVKQIHQQYVRELQATAKRLGIAYDESAVVPPIDKGVGNDTMESVNFASVAAQRDQQEYYGGLLKNNIKGDEATLSKQATQYGASEVFELVNTSLYNAKVMKNDKEDFTTTDPADGPPIGYTVGAEGDVSVDSLQYRYANRSLLEAYILPPNQRRTQHPQSIPVVVSIDAAVKSFGKSANIPDRPKKAKELSSWVKSTRDSLNGYTYSVCYRNESSRALVEQAIDQKKESAMNKAKPEYQQPTLSYTLPTQDSCGSVKTNDKRSAAEQANEKASQQLEREFEVLAGQKSEPPVQQKLDFVIVGLSPALPSYDEVLNLEGFVTSFVGINVPSANIIPRDMYDALPASAQHRDILTEKLTSNQQKYQTALAQQFLISFDDVDDARHYIEEKGCSFEDMSMENGCPSDKSFMLSAFGTNYMAINEAVRYGRPVLLVILSIVGTTAAIIIMAMMGRVMADSRRETAVFRAIGARRSDISRVYVLYSLAVAGRIALFATLLGFVIALILELLYASRASYYAESVFGVFDSGASFHFLGFNVYMIAIIAGIVSLGLIGVSLPLLRNIRRNPIQDMRDE